MEETRSFLPLFIVLLLAFVVPLLLSNLRRLRVPIAVGEIVAGLLVGKSGMEWVPAHDPILSLLADFGLVFLIFLAGIEIDFRGLRMSGPGEPSDARGWGPVGLGIVSFALTLCLAGLIAYGLTRLGLARNPWMMALILSTTSLGVVVPVLKERELNGTRFGQAILISTVIADFVTMLLIAVLVATVSEEVTSDILLIGLLFVAFFFTYRFGALLNRMKAVRRTIEDLSHATAQIKVRAAFTMMLVFVGLAEVLGTEVILGAFLAGAIVSLLRTPDDAELFHQLDAMGFGFFIPIFFVMVGVELDLPSLFSSPKTLLLVPVLFVAAIVVKSLPALVFRLAFSWRESLAAGALLSARLSLIIAAAAIGSELKIISGPVNAAIVLVAILTVTIAPTLFLRLMPARGPGRTRPIVVAGADELGLRVAEQLRAHHEPVLVIDSDEGRVARARQRGLEAVRAELDRQDGGGASHLEGGRALVCTYEDTELGYRVCRLARGEYGIGHVVAQVANPKDIARFKELGVTPMNAAVDRATLLTLLVRNPALYSLLSRTDDDKEVSEVVVGNRRYIGKALRELRLPGNVLVVALRRDGELLVPHGDTRLSLHDRITLVGSLADIDAAQRMFAGG